MKNMTIKPAWVFVALLGAWIVVVSWAVYNDVFLGESGWHGIWFVVSPLAVLVGAAAYTHYHIVIEREYAHVPTILSRASTDACEIVNGVVSRIRRPLVEAIIEPSELGVSAAKMIRNSFKTADILGYDLVFIGAASLQTHLGDDHGTDDESAAPASPGSVYRGAIEEVSSKKAKILRIVSELTDEEFKSRSRSKRENYISWLDNQIFQLKRNPNYDLLFSTRAPKWGTADAVVANGGQFLKLTEPEGVALSFEDDKIVPRVIVPVIKKAFEAKPGNKMVYTSGGVKLREKLNLSKYGAGICDTASVKKLQAYVEEVRKLLE